MVTQPSHCLIVGLKILACVFYLHLYAQSTKPILVLFNGVSGDAEDLKITAKSMWDQEAFSKVVVAKCNWKTELVPIAGPRIFRSLDKRYPVDRFILYGFDEGGLVVEWIAKRVKAADGRIARVVTVNTPLDGLSYGSKELLTASRLRDLQPASPTIRDLASPALNNLHSVEFVRVWESGNSKVSKESAFRRPGQTDVVNYHVVVRTKAYKPADQMPTLIAQAKERYQAGNWSGAIELLRQAVALAPDNAEANSLLGDSYFKMGTLNNDAKLAIAAFRESTPPLQKAIVLGRSITLPVRHQRVALVALDRYFCRGSITIARSSVHLISMCDASHDFDLSPSVISNLQFDFGSGHLSFSIPGGGRKKKPRNYDVFPLAIGVEDVGWHQSKRSFTVADAKLPPGAMGATEVVYNLLLAVKSP